MGELPSVAGSVAGLMLGSKPLAESYMVFIYQESELAGITLESFLSIFQSFEKVLLNRKFHD